jgi:hypothetical protein
MLRDSTSLCELIVAAFEQAATHTDDPIEISRLARAMILSILERADRPRGLLKN